MVQTRQTVTTGQTEDKPTKWPNLPSWLIEPAVFYCLTLKKNQSGAKIPAAGCLTCLHVSDSHTSTILVCLCLSETVYKKYSVLPSGYSFLLLLHAWFSLTWLHSLVRISIPYNYYPSSVTEVFSLDLFSHHFCQPHINECPSLVTNEVREALQH